MAKRSKKRKAAGSGVSAKVAVTGPVTPPLPFLLSRDWLWGLVLLLAVILVYQPVWYAGFLWDDDVHLTTNPCIIGPLGLKEIWTTSAAMICPLVLTTFWVEHALWGLAPLPYHLVNVLMHGACAVLLWRVLRGLQVPGAWLGAALWALHPVQVESVTWITEMKNTESGLFYLLSILFFVKGLRARVEDEPRGSGWNYALTLLFAALAMASKSSTVILPVVLCLCAWWVEGRWHWRNLAKVAPLFLMSIAAGAVSIWTQVLEGSNELKWEAPGWPERLVMTGDAVWFYLGKLLWPHPLMAIYPLWRFDTGQPLSYLPLLAVIIVPLLLWRKRESWSRPWFFAFAYFLVALLPILGLVNRYIADHYQYLPSMGPLALAGAGLARLADFTIPGRPWLQSSFCAGLLLILGMTSWQRAWVYQSEETLWTDTLAKNPNCWEGHFDLGYALFQKGEVDEAIVQYQKGLKINVNDAKARFNLGIALSQKGQVDKAMAQFQKALEINPNDAAVHYNLGVALARKGQADEAIVQYQKALEIDPNDAAAHHNLGVALARKGQVDEAMGQFNQALTSQPDFADALANRGQLKCLRGDLNGAITDLDRAIALDPHAPQPYLNRGLIKQMQGDFPAALANLRRFRLLAPKDPMADYALLWIWIIGNQQDQKTEADQEFAAAFSKNWNAAPGDWVSQNGRFLLGQIDEAGYLASAFSTDKSKDQDQHCEAWYYAGMKRLVAGDKITAMTDFRACLATGRTDFLEYTLAQAQLNALQPREAPQRD